MQSIPQPLVRANQGFIVLTVLLALILKQPYLLAIPLLIGLYSLALKTNPIFLLVKPFLKKPLSVYLQEDPAQQQFNQWISVICLALSFLGFTVGLPIIGYIFAVMVALAAFIAILGFCVGCFIRYQYLQWKQRHNSTQ